MHPALGEVVPSDAETHKISDEADTRHQEMILKEKKFSFIS